MATKTKSNLPAVRRAAPMVSKARYDNVVELRKRATARAKKSAQERMGTLVGAGACAALGVLEKRGTPIPTVAGLQPALLYGGLLAFVVPEFVSGKVAQVAAEAGAGLCGVAAYKLGRGEGVRVAGEYGE